MTLAPNKKYDSNMKIAWVDPEKGIFGVVVHTGEENQVVGWVCDVEE